MTWLTAAMVIGVVAFAVTGGVHDAANITAAAIASRALRPAAAVAIVAVFGFVGPFLAGTAVATTIGSTVSLGGLSRGEALRAGLGAVVAAAAWNGLTWRIGLPSSSTHSLVGALVGAAVATGGPDRVRWGIGALAAGRLEGVTEIAAGLVLSPLAGLLAGYLVYRGAAPLLRGRGRAWHRRLRRLQLATCALLALAYGANEAQKSMGVIALALLLGGTTDHLSVPGWAVVLAAVAIPAAAVAGGWPIVRTLGYGIYRLRPLHAAGAQAAAAAVVGVSSTLGAPVSTTQVASATIIGVGVADRPRAVRWDVGKSIAVSWLVTMPCAAAAGAALYGLLELAAEIAG